MCIDIRINLIDTHQLDRYGECIQDSSGVMVFGCSVLIIGILVRGTRPRMLNDIFVYQPRCDRCSLLLILQRCRISSSSSIYFNMIVNGCVFLSRLHVTMPCRQVVMRSQSVGREGPGQSICLRGLDVRVCGVAFRGGGGGLENGDLKP